MLHTGKYAAIAAILGVGLAVACTAPASAHYYGYDYRPLHGYGYGFHGPYYHHYGFYRPFHRHYGFYRPYRY